VRDGARLPLGGFFQEGQQMQAVNAGRGRKRGCQGVGPVLGYEKEASAGQIWLMLRQRQGGALTR